MAQKVKVTLAKSPIGKMPEHRATVRALGLRKVGKSRVFDRGNAAVAGMIRSVSHMLKVEEVNG